MCGGGNFYGGQGQSAQPGTMKPMQANPMTDMGSAGGNMPPDFQYRQMDPMRWPPQGGRAPPSGGRGFPPPPGAFEGRAGGNMSWGGDGWTPPQQPITNPMQAGGALGNYPQQPAPTPAFGGFSTGLSAPQPFQAGYQAPNTGQSWDPPQKDFAPGGGFYPTTTPTQIPSVTAGWMGLGGQPPNPNMTYNPVTRQWS